MHRDIAPQPCRREPLRVPLWRMLALAGVLGAATVLPFETQATAGQRDGGLRQGRPETREPAAPHRIPGEGVQEDAPAAEDEADERKAAPAPDIGGCPYRGRKLDLIV